MAKRLSLSLPASGSDPLCADFPADARHCVAPDIDMVPGDAQDQFSVAPCFLTLRGSDDAVIRQCDLMMAQKRRDAAITAAAHRILIDSAGGSE